MTGFDDIDRRFRRREGDGWGLIGGRHAAPVPAPAAERRPGCDGVRHAWTFAGGANCGCFPEAVCSVPVYECLGCGACDCGENAEADDVRRGCRGDATCAS